MSEVKEYLRYYENETDYDNARENDYDEPWVSYTENIDRVNYNKSEYEKLLETPLTFKIQSDGNIKWLFVNNSGNGESKTLEYKKNDGEWTEITSTTGGTTLSVVSGDTVQFRGDNTTISFSSTTVHYRNQFSGTTCNFAVKGNIMSLLDKTEFATATTLTSNFVFFFLFNFCTGLTDASMLVLPATTLSEGCYRNMFRNCTSLTSAPKLPARTLAYGCYWYMFNNCTSLTTAPELPATTMVDNCYRSMFYGCTSLTSAPELPATTLATYCYGYMFYSCTTLTQAPELPATTLADYCYNQMFQSCISLIIAPELPATTLADYCYTNMFQDCTSLVQAPELPATTLADYCYRSMFYCCTSLTTAPPSIGNSATTMAASACTAMFYGCTGLTTTPELPATTLANWCYSYMFESCTSLTTAPLLPATTLESNCYNGMFYGCSNLNYIKCLATDISTSNCTYIWVNSVAATGTFVKDANMTSWTTGNNGIPTGWTVQDAS